MTSAAEMARALARARAYDLFADLVLRGVTDDVATKLAGVPELEALVAGQSGDERAAAHYALFDATVFPFANVFLGDDGLAGGPAADALAALAARLGFRPTRKTPTLDHLSATLEALAFTLVSEIEHARHDEKAAARRWREAQREILDEHLLTWVPLLVVAVRREGDELYRTCAGLMLEAMLDHRRALADVDAAVHAAADTKVAAGTDVDAFLSSPRTSLADIARFLLTPARSGLYLARADLARLARSEALPRGFGDRRTELENLLRSAAQFDAVPALAKGLESLVAAWADALTPLDARVVPMQPTWLGRLEATRTLARRLQDAVARA